MCSSDLLLKKHCHPVRACNGVEAVEKFRELHPDLILMDIKMPKMNGLDATRVIRKFSTEVPIVAVSAFAYESDRQEALQAGCNDFLVKPVSVPALLEVVRKYL